MLVDFDGSNHLIADSMQSLEPVIRYCRSNTKENYSMKAVLLRPDGIVTWATSNSIDMDAIKAALARWVSPSELQQRFELSSQLTEAPSVLMPLSMMSNIGRSMDEPSAYEPVKLATTTVKA